jgi:diguanylate cyclase (GGDEF)-like protein
VLARYGGEEFAIILPEIDKHNALAFGEKIRRLTEKAVFRFEDTEIPVTVSVGVASLTPEVQETADFIKMCDDNLYSAKAAGRNKVVG